MPLPKTKDVSKLMRVLHKENPSMPRKQMIAISLNQARSAGANIPKPKKRKRKQMGKLEAELYRGR